MTSKAFNWAEQKYVHLKKEKIDSINQMNGKMQSTNEEKIKLTSQSNRLVFVVIGWPRLLRSKIYWNK